VCRQPIVRPQENVKKTGTKLHNTPALSALLYGSENWTVRARDARRKTAAETKYFRITARYALDRSYDKYTDRKGIECNPQFWTKYRTAEEYDIQVNIPRDTRWLKYDRD